LIVSFVVMISAVLLVALLFKTDLLWLVFRVVLIVLFSLGSLFWLFFPFISREVTIFLASMVPPTIGSFLIFTVIFPEVSGFWRSFVRIGISSCLRLSFLRIIFSRLPDPVAWSFRVLSSISVRVLVRFSVLIIAGVLSGRFPVLIGLVIEFVVSSTFLEILAIFARNLRTGLWEIVTLLTGLCSLSELDRSAGFLLRLFSRRFFLNVLLWS